MAKNQYTFERRVIYEEYTYVEADSIAEAKALEKMGFKKSWQRKKMENWSPGNYRGQSMSVREIGATAYAQVLTNYGFKAYSESRAD